jgi:hypothetical protein
MYTQRLPRKQRDDVALELRELLREERLFALLALRGRWNPWPRRVDLALEVGVVAVLLWFLAGPVFK